MPNKFFISDTHFSHDGILNFCKEYRPFDSIEEHDEFIIKKWNSIVSNRDTIVHLGDVCFKPATRLDQIMPRLNGIKKLVLGNHDVSNMNTYLKYFFRISSVHEEKKIGLLFSHYPVHPCQLDFRYKFNVHGHMHAHKINDQRYLNICCEHTDLAPISLDEILLRLEKQMDGNHGSTD